MDGISGIYRGVNVEIYSVHLSTNLYYVYKNITKSCILYIRKQSPTY